METCCWSISTRSSTFWRGLGILKKDLFAQNQFAWCGLKEKTLSIRLNITSYICLEMFPCQNNSNTQSKKKLTVVKKRYIYELLSRSSTEISWDVTNDELPCAWKYKVQIDLQYLWKSWSIEILIEYPTVLQYLLSIQLISKLENI